MKLVSSKITFAVLSQFNLNYSRDLKTRLQVVGYSVNDKDKLFH